jgi:muramidase (phage lysozyme)
LVKVPLYQENQDRVALRPEYTETLVGGATADAFGSAIGKGLQSVASGMDVAAEAVQRVQQMRDEAVVSDGANQWLQAKDKLLYDPDTGYANTQGRQAVEGFDAYQKSVQGLKRDIVAKMSPAQTGLFNKQVAAYETDALRSGMIKKADETKKWLLQEHTAAAENYSRQAIQTPDDETRWNGFVGRGLQELDARGAKEGWGEQRTQLERATYISNVRLQSALRIAENDPIRAAKYATDHVADITPQDHMILLDRLKPDLKKAASADAAHFNASNPAPGQFAATGLSHDQYALLSVISDTESPSYDLMNGGQRITDYAAHPGFIGADGTTTATGRYQMVKGTWDMAAKALGLTDFSPASQDRAAAWVAQASYRTKTGRDLMRDIQDGNYTEIRHELETTWEGLKKISDEEFARRMGAARSAPLAVSAAAGAASGLPSGSPVATAAPATTPGSEAVPPQPAGPRFSPAVESVLKSLPPAYADEIRESAADAARTAAAAQTVRDRAAQTAQAEATRLRIANGDTTLTARDIHADTVIDHAEKPDLLAMLDEKRREALATNLRLQAFAAEKLVIDAYSEEGRKANDNVWSAIVAAVVEPEKQDQELLKLISQTGAVPTPVFADLRRNLTRGDPASVQKALERANWISSADHGALARMPGGTELADAAVLYEYYRSDIDMEPGLAVQRIIDLKDPEKVRQRKAMMDTPWMKGTIDYLATEELIKPLYRKGIVSWTSLGNEKQAAAIISDYKQILTESIFDAGDVGPGLTLANERLQRLYGVSEFSADGKDVLMHLPPEKFYPDDGTGSHDYIWKQLNEEFARDGIKHGKIFLYADRDTEIDIAAGKRPHYQVQFVNEKGELEHYRKPFFANPPTADEIKAAGDAALDKKIAEGEAENRKEEQERLQDKLFSRILMHTITDPLTWLLPKPAP